MMLNDFDVFMIVSLPPGAFAPYSDVKTALMFFKRSGSTEKVLYYEMLLPENLKKFSKGSKIGDEHFSEARQTNLLLKQFGSAEIPSEKFTDSNWIVDAQNLAEKEFDISARNPNQAEDEILPPPSKLTARILENQENLQAIIIKLHKMVSETEDFS
jgi:type I restriction enzyme M protein